MSSAPEWRFLQFYVPLWLVFAYNFVLYAFLFTHLRALAKSRGADAAEVLAATISPSAAALPPR